MVRLRGITLLLLAVVFVCVSAASGETPVPEGRLAPGETNRIFAPGLEHLLLARGEVGESTGYRILVGVFSSQSEASQMLERLSALGVDAFPESGGGKYSVVTPSSPRREAAEALRRRLIELGLAPPLEIQEITQDPNAAAGRRRRGATLFARSGEAIPSYLARCREDSASFRREAPLLRSRRGPCRAGSFLAPAGCST